MNNLTKSNGDQPNRLPFYKPPQQKTNIYQFEKKDLARSSVVQQRFKQSTSTSSSSSSTTVNQVTEGSQADQAGLKLGDSVTKINQVETKNMSLTEASKTIQQAGNELKLSVKSFEEDEKISAATQEREVVLKADTTSTKSKSFLTEQRDGERERKVWHPVVWQQSTSPVEQSNIPGQDAPHKRIIRNIHRFFKDTENNPEARQKYIEDMLLALPTASKTF